MSSGSSKDKFDNYRLGSLTGSNTALDLPKSNLSSCDTSDTSSLNSLCSSPSAGITAIILEREMSEEDKNVNFIQNRPQKLKILSLNYYKQKKRILFYYF